MFLVVQMTLFVAEPQGQKRIAFVHDVDHTRVPNGTFSAKCKDILRVSKHVLGTDHRPMRVKKFSKKFNNNNSLAGLQVITAWVPVSVEFHMLSLCPCGLPLGSPVFPHHPKPCWTGYTKLPVWMSDGVDE